MDRPIIVRRSVLRAAQELEDKYDPPSGSGPLNKAERKINQCQKNKDSSGMKFWRSVWIHLMLTRYAPDEIKVIADEDEKSESANKPASNQQADSLTGTHRR